MRKNPSSNWRSLDGRTNAAIRNTHVPLWNYVLLRGQIFLVYFIAGLKKMDRDWVGGYSMENLGHHWVFDGFRLFLSDDEITFFVVHIGGFLLDLTIGFFMLLDFSRPYAFVFCGAFNLMNSRMFSIGMFPYVMIAIMPIFCSADWPKKAVARFSKIKDLVLYRQPTGVNSDCIYWKEEECVKSKVRAAKKSTSLSHKMTALGICLYFCLQGFLPYSHWLTKGYNTWTQGLYGYSWDMMVHHWRYVHTKVTVLDKNSGHRYFVDPLAWTPSHRWSHHADMVKQFSHCVEDRLAHEHNLTDVEVYVDVWISLNRRFTQRMYDPTVDILTALWSPFEEVTWVLPLQTELTTWREKLLQMERKLFQESDNIDIVFVTDFPGLSLLSYVHGDLENTTLEVLSGEVQVEFQVSEETVLAPGQRIQIPSGLFHRVTPLKHKPSCYMYTFINKTRISLEAAWQERNNLADGSTCPLDQQTEAFFQIKKRKHDLLFSSCWDRYRIDFWKKFEIWSRSVTLIGRALLSIITATPMTVEKIQQPIYTDMSLD